MTASLLVAGTTAAMADPEPTPTPGATTPTVTTFPRAADPDAPLRAAIEEAKKQGKPVAVEAVYTESSRTWAYPDGHLTLQSYAGPSQLKQPDGSWAWIDTTLVERDGALKPKLAKADVTFSLGGDGPFASMERGKSQRFALSWSKELPRPEVTGNVARYINAAGPKADLVVTALPTGFRHDVVLRERPTEPLEMRIPVETDGLTLIDGKKGKGLALVDGKGKQVASAAEPVMTDAGPSPTEADNGKATPPRTATIDTRVESENGRQVLVLRPDPAFLNDPATRYPLTVDPTTTLPLLSDVVIGSDDIIDTSPASQKLETSKQRTYTDGHITYAHSLLKFDTSVLAGRAVGNARLEMYVEQDVACRWYGPGGVEVKRITSGWKADTVRWSNQPSVTSFGSSIQLCPNTSQIDPNGNWIPRTNTWDVTAMANAWAAGAQSEGIQVSAYSDIDHLPGQGNGFWIYYHSAERVGGTPPKLTVSYWLPPEIPTVTAESIDSLSGNDAIARSQNVKVGFKSAVPEATNLDYTVTVNDSTMQPPPAFPAGHLAHWKFDEAAGATTAADASGNGYTATYGGSRHGATTGKLGGAVKLNDMQGSTGSLPDSYASTSKPVLNQNSSFSISTWFKLHNSDEIQYLASQDGNPVGLSIYYLGASWQKVRLQVSGTGGSTGYGVWVDSAKLVKADTWTHMVAMYDATAAKIRIYIDGTLSAETDFTPTNTVTSGPFRIGADKANTPIHLLQGSLDDMRLYQRALTLKEIKDLYGEVAATSYNAKPSGQVINQTFDLHNPASLKFVVKACRSGVTPPSCNESPAYRITSDAPMLPTDTESGMADPTQPILSGMVNRPSGGVVTAKYYLYDNAGNPVGSAPLGTRTVSGGERASFQIPANTVQLGTTYKWQMTACASGETAADEVCTAKTAPVSFTTPGTPPPPPTEDVRHLTLGKDSFVIKTAKTDPTACAGAPCTVTDDTVMRIGGTGVDKTAAVVGFKLDELPDGAGVSEGILKLGTAVCPAGMCPADAVVTATPLKSPVTSESKGSDLAADADTGTTPYSLPLSDPQTNIAGSEYQWLLLTSNKDEVITFADPAATEPPSLVFAYLPAGPPSKVINLAASGGDASALASWGLPESNGSVAMLDGYDVEVFDNSGASVKTLEVKDPWAAVSGLANGQTYTFKVRAKTVFGTSDWEAAIATTKAVPPAPTSGGGGTDTCIPFLDAVSQGTESVAAGTSTAESGAQTYLDRVLAYYQAQDAVLEGRAGTIWDAPGVNPSTPSTAKLSLLNDELVRERTGMERVQESRSNSTVTLGDAVVQVGFGGSIRVTVKVERTWIVQDAASPSTAGSTSSSATRIGTSGAVEPSDSTIAIHVFDRCGNMTEIQAPIPANEDATDVSDDLEAPNAGGSGTPDTKCEKEPRDGNGYSTMAYDQEYYQKLGKNWEIHAVMCSQWRSAWDATTGTDYWPTTKHINYMRLYPRNGDWTSAESKYRQRNMEMTSKATVCFYNTKYKFEPSGEAAFDVKGGAGSVGLGIAFSAGRGVECIPYEETLKDPKSPDPKDPPRRPTIYNRMPEIYGECFQDALEWCVLDSYQHRMIGEFTYWYHAYGKGGPKVVADRIPLRSRWLKYDGQFDGSH
ncbi:DNRLRE domain-containing protein [Nonomuraea sp. NBC_01738]|uniref:LamG-like jellyroll fold domain-containing protein n=1 Tax=Nonomuraea sp. NBC_01738 TaxID=2976003 RepID=UPI002E0F1F6F|nr:DNRLRE domain-containing protein [Nonomuraea sp. NBC_01738]